MKNKITCKKAKYSKIYTLATFLLREWPTMKLRLSLLHLAPLLRLWGQLDNEPKNFALREKRQLSTTKVLRSYGCSAMLWWGISTSAFFCQWTLSKQKIASFEKGGPEGLSWSWSESGESILVNFGDYREHRLTEKVKFYFVFSDSKIIHSSCF